jgi:hypothetical protein
MGIIHNFLTLIKETKRKKNDKRKPHQERKVKTISSRKKREKFPEKVCELILPILKSA